MSETIKEVEPWTEEERRRYDRLFDRALASDDQVQRAVLFGRAGCIKRAVLKRARLGVDKFLSTPARPRP